VPSNADKLEKNTPSDDELNPLSNPLLAAHMGRWAEVYFTNRPEDRDRAVLDLLRELEIETGAKKAAQPGGVTAPSESPEKAPTSTQMSGASASGILCDSCGYINSDTHSYCGMCGIPLTGAAQPYERSSAPPPREREVDERSGLRSGDPADEWRDSLAGSAEREDAFSNPFANLDDSDLPHFARQAEAVPYRGRLYVGLVLAILLGGLIYVAKRGTVFFDGQRSPDSRIMPAAQPAPETEAAQNRERNTPSPVETETQENPLKPMSKANSQSEMPSQQTPLANSSTPVPKAGPAIAAQRALPDGQSGSQDLIEAQRDLGGSQGNAREAVPLLWNAVAEGNRPAMVALSDLYLRGDGVSQNCDQARVLLDSAAKKGAKGAGERLRHLQAFGCR
jgi:hypothetical protein